MKLTVIPEDQIIVLDGAVVATPFVAPANIHAIQWDGVEGTIEHKVGPPSRITNVKDVQFYLDKHADALARKATERAAEEAKPKGKPQSLVDQIIANPAELAKLKAALAA